MPMPMTRKKAEALPPCRGGSYGSQGWGLPGAYKSRRDGSEKHVREGRPQAGRQRPAGSGQRRSDSGGCGQPPRGDEPPPGSRRKAPPFSAKSALPELARRPMTNCARSQMHCIGAVQPLSVSRLSPLPVSACASVRLRLPRCEPATACISHRIGSSYDRAKTGMWTPGHAMMRQSSPLPTMYVAACCAATSLATIFRRLYAFCSIPMFMRMCM
jgi:hypothetical protein